VANEFTYACLSSAWWPIRCALARSIQPLQSDGSIMGSALPEEIVSHPYRSLPIDFMWSLHVRSAS